jgi:hypothetical protein
MFGKDAECSSVEATSLLFSAGAEPRPPGLCAQRSCTPLLCKLKADRMSAWRTGRRPLFRAAGGKASWEVDCLSQSFSACRLAACAPLILCEIKPHAPSRAQRSD